jgi:hypothetical protein
MLCAASLNTRSALLREIAGQGAMVRREAAQSIVKGCGWHGMAW